MWMLRRIIALSVTAVAATVTAVILYDAAQQTRTSQQAAWQANDAGGSAVGVEAFAAANVSEAPADSVGEDPEAALDAALYDALLGEGAAPATAVAPAVAPAAAAEAELAALEAEAGDLVEPDGPYSPLSPQEIAALADEAAGDVADRGGDPLAEEGLAEEGLTEEAAVEIAAEVALAAQDIPSQGIASQGIASQDIASQDLPAQDRGAEASGDISALAARPEIPDDAVAGESTEPEAAFEAFVRSQRAADRLRVGDALLRNYPQSDEVLMRALYAAALEGADQRELDRRRTQFVAALLAEKIAYTPYASLKALRTYVSYNLNLADLARLNFGAEACAEAVTRGGAAFSARLRSAPPVVVEEIVQALSDQTGAILDAAREGEQTGPRDLTPPDSAAWRELHRSMERLGATRSQIGMLMSGAAGAPEDLCDATQAFYAALLSLEDAEASTLLPFVTKTMVGGASP